MSCGRGRRLSINEGLLLSPFPSLRSSSDSTISSKRLKYNNSAGKRNLIFSGSLRVRTGGF